MASWEGPSSDWMIKMAQKRRDRVLKLSLAGASNQMIADDLGVAYVKVQIIRKQLRKDGELGCCHKPSCMHRPANGDYTGCKFWIA